MSTTLVGITMKFPDWLLKVRQKENDIYLLIAATMQTNRGLMFDDSNAGRTAWAKPKFREGQALSQRGALRQSFGPNNDGVRPAIHPDGIVRINQDTVTIGTKVVYAETHNRGAVIRPKKAKFLWIPLPAGRANSSNAPTDQAKGLRKQAGRKKKSDWKWTKVPNGPLLVTSPSGKVFLLAKKATIPRRPLDEWNAMDQAELEETVINKLTEILNGTD